MIYFCKNGLSITRHYFGFIWLLLHIPSFTNQTAYMVHIFNMLGLDRFSQQACFLSAGSVWRMVSWLSAANLFRIKMRCFQSNCAINLFCRTLTHACTHARTITHKFYDMSAACRTATLSPTPPFSGAPTHPHPPTRTCTSKHIADRLSTFPK